MLFSESVGINLMVKKGNFERHLWTKHVTKKIPADKELRKQNKLKGTEIEQRIAMTHCESISLYLVLAMCCW